MAPSRPCLLVTYLSLTRLTERTNGSYRRLALMAAAIRSSGAPLRVCCALSPEDAGPSVADACEKIQAEIRKAWNLESTVVATVLGASSNAPWILQQAAAAWKYGLSPVIRSRVTPEARALLASELARDPAFIVAHRLPAMFALTGLGVPLPPTFFDLDDVEHVVALRRATRAHSVRDKVLGLMALPSLFLEERRSVHRATRTLVCSDADASRLRKVFGKDSVDSVPNALPLPTLEPGLSATHSMLMVAAYDYEPNADGADFFIAEVLPLIRSRLPTAELWLVGPAAEKMVAFSNAPAGVKFLGFVPDLDAVYEAARIVICPIRYGGGTRVKLVEAAGYAKPIVSTTLGAEGLGMINGVHALIADSPESLADACTTLLQDDEQCMALSREVRMLAEDKFDARHVSERLGRVFRSFAEMKRHN
jgi:hypothetical protein